MLHLSNAQVHSSTISSQILERGLRCWRVERSAGIGLLCWRVLIRVPKLCEAELLLDSLGSGGVRILTLVPTPRHAPLPLQEDAVLLVQGLVVAVHGSQRAHLWVMSQFLERVRLIR